MKKIVSIIIIGLLFFNFVVTVNKGTNIEENNCNSIVDITSDVANLYSSINKPQFKDNNTEIFLPLPLDVNLTYRDAIMQRCSVRQFDYREPVDDKILSTILWAAYGTRNDGSRTIYPFEDSYSTIIYVFREEAAYTYNPINHSLELFEEGDLRRTVNWQHVAPIQLGIVWDSSKNDDANYSSVEMGEIGQNIYFMSSALGLGTVTAALTGFDDITLPEGQLGRIVMPLGYPLKDPEFEYNPNIISLLPRVQDSSLNLKTVIETRRMDSSFAGTIEKQDLSQLLWASYGFSYYLDTTETTTNEVERHRTVPSASCVYPLVFFAVTTDGIYRYVPHILHLNPYSDNPFFSTNWALPVISLMIPMRQGDHRQEIAEASYQLNIASAPIIIVSTLRYSTNPEVQWYWYFESGASAYNVMLESTILDLHAGIVKPTDVSSINSIMRLNDEFLPLIIIPVGE